MRVRVIVLVAVSVPMHVLGLRCRGKVQGLVGVSMDKDIDFCGSNSIALNAMGDQLCVKAKRAGSGLQLVQ
jgi:hypothetical protein